LNETSGLDVLVELRAKLPNLPVVMLSGDGTPATVAKTRAMGAHGFVLKPFNPEGLFKAIDRAMAGENAPPAQP
jgi:two-component system response regulator RegA